ncbi:MAG TPA: hypothetical protein VKE69_09520 [Planctomycetota bacterium]|nr:hypothetical protein [Planctomycetota bacterium]
MNPPQDPFPGLLAGQYSVTSPATPVYNCIAWAAGSSAQWWWPDPASLYFWPNTAPRAATVEAFQKAFASLAYTVCESSELEAGIEKVAIFASPLGVPTHAARQLENGRWTSKMGREIDIEHLLLALEGPGYGRVVRLMQRSRTQSQIPPTTPAATSSSSSA